MRRAARGRWKRTLTCGVCTALLASALPLGAQTDDENARIHYESGAAYLKQSDNENALREFQAAYTLSKRPELLLNIATVYERMGKPKDAADSLAKYLDENPKTAERTTIETRIANLRKRAEATPPPVASANPSASAEPLASAAPSAPAPPPPSDALPATGPNRVPAYAAFGIGGAAAIGALITGLAANAKFHDAETTCKPNCTDSKVSSIKSMAIASDVLTGVAVVGVGVGAVLFFTAKPPSEATGALHPAVQAGWAPGSGKVQATWRF